MIGAPARFAILIGQLMLTTLIVDARDVSQIDRRGSAGRVTFKVDHVKEHYCWDGPGSLPMLRLDVEASLTNDTDATLLLFLGGAYVQGIQVAETVGRLFAGDYAADVTPFEAIAGGDNPTIRDGNFAAIRSHTTYPFYAGRTAVFLRNAEWSYVKGRGLLTPGTYAASVTLAAWPYSEELSARWRRKLAGRGTLLTDPISSEPFSISVADSPTFAKCNESHAR